MSKKFMLGVLFAFVLCGMLAMAVAGGSRFPVVNAIVASVMLPVESAFNSVGNAGNSLRGYWKALTVMQSENEQLKRDNIELRNANIQMASVYAENRQLRALLDYKEQHKSQRVVAAKVIARNHGDLRDSMYIDAGEDKGLKREMAVVNEGLVGVVDEVTCASPSTHPACGEEKYRVALMDYGAKRNIVRELQKRGCTVTVWPALT